jgi:hypothetical protein
MIRRTGRFLHISCRKGQHICIRGVRIDSVGYPVEARAQFRCSDDLLNRIWETSVYTSKLLMQYGYQDCLKREQGTFNTNQNFYQSLAAAYCFGDHALLRKGILTALRTQQDDGWFHSHGPSSPNQDEVTGPFGWMLLLREYYMLVGDLAFVEQVFPMAEDMLRFFGKWTNRQGLLDGRHYVVSRPGHLIYLDDPQTDQDHIGHFPAEMVAFNLLYVDALEAAAFLATELKQFERAKFYQRKALWIRSTGQARLWDIKRGLFANWRKGDQLCERHHPVHQIAAVYHGLADDKQREAILDYLVNELGLDSPDRPDYPLSTFGYYYYYLEVLFCNGYDRMALDLIRGYFGHWLEAGATTFGEGFHRSQLKEHPLDFEYEVHGYGTSAHAHFYTSILGVRPLEPGFKRILIAPKPGDLEWAEGSVNTPEGIVRVSWRKSDTQFHLSISAPSSCQVEYRTPAGLSPLIKVTLEE